MRISGKGRNLTMYFAEIRRITGRQVFVKVHTWGGWLKPKALGHEIVFFRYDSDSGLK